MSSVSNRMLSPVGSESSFSDYDYVEISSPSEIGRRILLAKEDFAELEIPTSRKSSFSSLKSPPLSCNLFSEVSLKTFLSRCLESASTVVFPQGDVAPMPSVIDIFKTTRSALSLEQSQDRFVYRLKERCKQALIEGKDLSIIEERCRWGLSLKSGVEAKASLAAFFITILIERHLFKEAEDLANKYISLTTCKQTQFLIREGLLKSLKGQSKFVEVEVLAKKFLELDGSLDMKLAHSCHLSFAQYTLTHYEDAVTTAETLLDKIFPSFSEPLALILCGAKNELKDFETAQHLSRFYLSQASDHFKVAFANELTFALIQLHEYKNALTTAFAYLNCENNYENHSQMIVLIANAQNKLGHGKATFRLLSPLLMDIDYIKMIPKSIRCNLLNEFNEAITQSSFQPEN